MNRRENEYNERRRSSSPVRRLTHRSISINQDAQIRGRIHFFKREDKSPTGQRQVAMKWIDEQSPMEEDGHWTRIMEKICIRTEWKDKQTLNKFKVINHRTGCTGGQY